MQMFTEFLSKQSILTCVQKNNNNTNRLACQLAALLTKRANKWDSLKERILKDNKKKPALLEDIQKQN